ncbi:unnamed protein product [Ambrosiozyma monospora]|uniref:Unnamed protein product n=1 Tax=Ambrosiozyma monospora TaxID=43982 RepID=A0ACB5SY92_AMBMO|nr:unnamed protein product [Ambrosiozyma monospora]
MESHQKVGTLLPNIPNKPLTTTQNKQKQQQQPHQKQQKPQNFKKSRLYNSRQIRTEIQDPSFTNPNSTNSNKSIVNVNNLPNKLDIPRFLSSRQFEITEFSKSQARSSNSRASRIVQTLPRSMRRRTASHNVNRIPKRLRKKALREMGLSLSVAHKNAKQLDGKETKGVKENGKPAKKKHARVLGKST